MKIFGIFFVGILYVITVFIFYFYNYIRIYRKHLGYSYDTYTNSKHKKSVIIIPGGAWVFNFKTLYLPLSNFLFENGYDVYCIGSYNYPFFTYNKNYTYCRKTISNLLHKIKHKEVYFISSSAGSLIHLDLLREQIIPINSNYTNIFLNSLVSTDVMYHLYKKYDASFILKKYMKNYKPLTDYHDFSKNKMIFVTGEKDFEEIVESTKEFSKKWKCDFYMEHFNHVDLYIDHFLMKEDLHYIIDIMEKRKPVVKHNKSCARLFLYYINPFNYLKFFA